MPLGVVGRPAIPAARGGVDQPVCGHRQSDRPTSNVAWNTGRLPRDGRLLTANHAEMVYPPLTRTAEIDASARPAATLDSTLTAALARSHLARIGPSARAVLLRGSRTLEIHAAGTFRPAGEPGPHLEMVVSGLVRVFLESPDGRRLTVRYCRAGGLLGAASLFRPGFLMPGSLQALTDSVVLSFDPRCAREVASADATVAEALLTELSERTLSFVAQISGTAFTTVGQRVARHLLDLASEAQRGDELRADVSQQDLADAAGSVREVVVRVLRDFRAAGLIETRRGTILLRAPEALLDVASAG